MLHWLLICNTVLRHLACHARIASQTTNYLTSCFVFFNLYNRNRLRLVYCIGYLIWIHLQIVNLLVVYATMRLLLQLELSWIGHCDWLWKQQWRLWLSRAVFYKTALLRFEVWFQHIVFHQPSALVFILLHIFDNNICVSSC